MSESNPSADDRQRARIVARMTTDFVLNWVETLARLHDGDVIRALVTATIVSANTSHLTQRSANAAPHASLDDVPPDSERRPVSVMAVSQAMGLPFETTRRYVNKLIELGIARRVKGGVIVLSTTISHPANEAAIIANAAMTRRFVRDLGRAGLSA